MKFEKGDIVQHKLSGEKMMILTTNEIFLTATNSVGNFYGCRMEKHLDLIYKFDEVELEELGSEKV